MPLTSPLPPATRRVLLASLLGWTVLPSRVARAGTAVAEVDVAVDTTRHRYLWLYNSNTREQVAAWYVRDGAWHRPGLATLDHLMRDHRADTQRSMHPHLYELLFAIQQYMSTRYPLVVTSAYRTRESNKRLAEKIPGVAVNSLHVDGLAADLYVPGRPASHPAALARHLGQTLGLGGVGSYPRHIHLDVGPLRSWNSTS